MLGLVIFLFLSFGALFILIWIRAAAMRNVEDLCETCSNKKYLNGKMYDNSPCQRCSKMDSMYELDKSYLKGEDI